MALGVKRLEMGGWLQVVRSLEERAEVWGVGSGKPLTGVLSKYLFASMRRVTQSDQICASESSLWRPQEVCLGRLRLL